MNKFLVSILGVFFVYSLCFAQQPMSTTNKLSVPAVVKSTNKTKEVATVKGEVKSVTVADASQGSKSEITISEDNGRTAVFLVKSTTTIYGADWKAITLNKISKNATVKVKYDSTKDGANEALLIILQK